MKDDEILQMNAHIPDSEVLQDISETEQEIKIRQRLNYDPDGVQERQEFIDCLKHLLELRRSQCHSK
jgi:hypothetical protein